MQEGEGRPTPTPTLFSFFWWCYCFFLLLLVVLLGFPHFFGWCSVSNLLSGGAAFLPLLWVELLFPPPLRLGGATFLSLLFGGTLAGVVFPLPSPSFLRTREGILTTQRQTGKSTRPPEKEKQPKTKKEAENQATPRKEGRPKPDPRSKGNPQDQEGLPNPRSKGNPQDQEGSSTPTNPLVWCCFSSLLLFGSRCRS